MKEIPSQLQIEINRQLWIQALRDNEHRQCTRALRRVIGNMVCAYGLAENILKVTAYSGVSEALGIGMGKPGPYKDNDNGWTFTQIADAAERGRYWSINRQ